jgi:predicted metal-dependent enzyme (double-stranded beta helix superfamily)
MWAVIGIYTGREDNIFWRRPADDPGGRIEAAGARALSEREVTPSVDTSKPAIRGRGKTGHRGSAQASVL